MAIVLSVVIAGAGVALAFRKEGAALRFWQSGADDPFGRVERRVGTRPAWSGAAAGTIPAGEPATRVPAAATAAISQPRGLAPDNQPAFQKNLSPVGALLAPIEGIVGEEDELETLEGAGAPSQFPAADGALRHVVVDGDTLGDLAARYLGRAEAATEIFELNRHVLATPDLLPIGAVLKIPARRAPANDSSGTSGRRPAKGETLRMVPVGERQDAPSS
jgi:hypothetical protein